jgi:hypothetical protein
MLCWLRWTLLQHDDNTPRAVSADAAVRVVLPEAPLCREIALHFGSIQCSFDTCRAEEGGRGQSSGPGGEGAGKETFQQSVITIA